MGATFSRLKNWIAEVLTYADLNAEIDNILSNLGPVGVDDYSTNVAQMQSTTDPGEVGTESLATSLAGEIQRLRFAIKEIKGSGAAQWYSTAGTSLTELAAALGNGLPANRIASGKASANSSQLIALDPDGTARTVVLDGSPTSFVYYINSTQYTISTDVSLTGLTAPPTSNNTCLVNDTLLSADQFTQFLGEYDTTITVDAMGSEISNRVNQYAAFSIVHGGNTEYFIAYINSSTSLTKCWRGCFFNSSQAAVPKIVFSDNDTITLLKLSWIFATTAGTIVSSDTVPTYSGTQPSSPISDDYWFDIPNNTWKKYSSGSFVSAGATLIGITAQTGTACVAARTFDAFASVSDTNSVVMERVSNTVMQVRDVFSTVNVNGSTINYGLRLPTWDITANLDSGLVEAASTYYYLYIKENGDTVISDLAPTELKGMRRGRYHPSECWRCIGVVYNDGSSNFDATKFSNFGAGREIPLIAADAPQGYGLAYTVAASAITVKLTDRIGNYPSSLIPTYVTFGNPTATDGSYALRPLTQMLTATIPSTGTLGHGTTADCYVFVSIHNNSGTLLLGVSSVLWDDNKLSSTTLLDTGSDNGAIYTPTALTSKPFRRLGYLYYATGLAGTWAAPTRIALGRSASYEGRASFSSSDPTQTEWGVTSGQFWDMTSLALAPGEYEMSAAFNTVNNGSISTTFIAIGISTTSGDSNTGLVQGLNFATGMVTDTTSGRQSGIMVSDYEVSNTALTTYYLKAFSQVVGGNFESIGYRLTAKRKTYPKAPA